jgi:hypothetical protein
MSAGSITLLRPLNGRPPTKTIGPDGNGGLVVTRSYSNSTWWSGEVISFNGIAELAGLLNLHSEARDCIVVAGDIMPDVDRSQMLRRTKVGKNGEPPTLDDDTRRTWIGLDVDKLPLPEGFDPLADLRATVAYVIAELLPIEFQGADCWASFTSSAGLRNDGTVSLRLVFVIDRATSTHEEKLWLPRRQYGHLDASVYGRHQPIYIAAPIIAPGGRDPLEGRQRCGLIRFGREVVTVPEIREPQHERSTGSSRTDDGPRSASFEEALGRIGDHEGGEGAYGACRYVVGWYFGRYGADADPAPLKAAILERIAQAQWDPKGKHTPTYFANEVFPRLDNLIESIQNNQRNTEAQAAKRAKANRRWPDEGEPLHDAEQALKEVIDRFFTVTVPRAKAIRTSDLIECDDAITADDIFDDRRIGVRVTPAVGKTLQASAAAVRGIAEGIRSVIAIPTHNKADEIQQSVNRLAGRKVAAVWRGLSQPIDPNMPDGERMCPRHETVAELVKAGGTVNDLCGTPTKPCPLRDKCQYRAQQRLEPEVWIVAHKLLEYPPPRPVAGADCLVIDEARSVEIRHDRLRIEEQLLAEREHVPDVLEHVAAALQAHPDGYFAKEVFTAAGVTSAACRGAREHDARNFPKLKVDPASPDAEVARSAKAAAKPHRAAVLRSRFWRELERFLQGDIGTSTRLRKAGDDIHISAPREVRPAWLSRPVLHLDATLDEAVARSWLPNLELVADIRVARPAGVRVRQVVDQAVAYSKIIPGLHAPEGSAARQTQERRFASIMRKLEVLCARERSVGLICPQQFEAAAIEYWNARGGLPANLILDHFGHIRGMNNFEKVSRLIVVSRMEPSAAEIEAIARVVFDRHPEHSLAGSLYPRRDVGLRMAGDGVASVSETFHPDAGCQAILSQIRDAEVAQAVHRARPIRRDAGHPLQIDILTNVPVDLTVDETTTLDAWLEVDPAELMAARGFVPDSWEGRWLVLRDVYPNVEAIKKAGQRRGGVSIDAGMNPGHSPYRYSLHKGNVPDSIEPAAGPPHPVKPDENECGTFPYKADVTNSPAAPSSRSRWARFKYRQFTKRKGGYVWVDLDRHPDPEDAWSAVLEHPEPFFGWCDQWEPADPPQPRDWLQDIAGLYAHVVVVVEVEVEVESPPLVPDATLDRSLAALSWLD